MNGAVTQKFWEECFRDPQDRRRGEEFHFGRRKFAERGNRNTRNVVRVPTAETRIKTMEVLVMANDIIKGLGFHHIALKANDFEKSNF